MYFYVNLSCGEANLDKLGFGKLRVWLFLACFNGVFGFFSNFIGRFWPFLKK